MIAANDGNGEFAPAQALVISASEENGAALSAALVFAGLVPVICSSTAQACKLIEGNNIGIIFCDDCLPGYGLEKVVAEVRKRSNRIPVVATSRTGEWAEFLEALRIGALDFLSLPPRQDEVDRVLASVLGNSVRAGNGFKVGNAT